jgi:hypothetical protein
MALDAAGTPKDASGALFLERLCIVGKRFDKQTGIGDNFVSAAFSPVTNHFLLVERVKL